MSQTNPRVKSAPQAPLFDRLAAPYDRGMAPLETLALRRLRARLLSHVRGRVLEIGAGTGATFPFYPPAVCVTAIDESSDMLAVAVERTKNLGVCVHLSQMDVEALAFPTAAFDTIVTSLVLCSVVDQRRALAELRRVLRRPDGRLLLLEHMRPQVRLLARLVDLLNVPWLAINGRCNLNRETQQAIVQAGFSLEHVESKLGGFLRLIVARAV